MSKSNMLALGYTLCEGKNVAYKKQGKTYFICEYAGEKGKYCFCPIRATNRWSANKILALYGAKERF